MLAPKRIMYLSVVIGMCSIGLYSTKTHLFSAANGPIDDALEKYNKQKEIEKLRILNEKRENDKIEQERNRIYEQKREEAIKLYEEKVKKIKDDNIHTIVFEKIKSAIEHDKNTQQILLGHIERTGEKNSIRLIHDYFPVGTTYLIPGNYYDVIKQNDETFVLRVLGDSQLSYKITSGPFTGYKLESGSGFFNSIFRGFASTYVVLVK